MLGAAAGDVLVVQEDTAGAGTQQAREHAEQGALPGSVRADQPDDRRGRHGQVHGVHGDDTAEADGYLCAPNAGRGAVLGGHGTDAGGRRHRHTAARSCAVAVITRSDDADASRPDRRPVTAACPSVDPGRIRSIKVRTWRPTCSTAPSGLRATAMAPSPNSTAGTSPQRGGT